MRGDRAAPATPIRSAWAAIGALVALVVVAAPLALLALDDGAEREQRAVHTDALATVRAAVGQTFAAGSYEMDTVSTAMQGGRVIEITADSIVNLEPYAMTAQSTSSAFGNVTLHVNATHAWQLGAATAGYGPGAPGVPLFDYSRQVVGSIGRGPGALAMISIASRGGYLNLEEESVAAAEPGGTGTVDGVTVTYYDVTIDIRKLAGAAHLSDAQSQTIAAAVPLLEQSGYTGTSERLGVDDAGYIRSVDSTTSFEDGSSMVRRSVLSNFGCAPTVAMPNEAAAPPVTTQPCLQNSTTTSTMPGAEPPTTTPATTSAPPTSSVPSTGAPATTTTAAAETTTTTDPSTTTTSPDSTTPTSSTTTTSQPAEP
jgi:hypothetical protein